MADLYKTKSSQIKSIEDNAKLISAFINGNVEGKENNKRSKINKHVLPREYIIDALSKLQPTYKSEYIAGQKANINTDTFKTALLNSIAKVNPSALTRSVNQIDGRTIDFVEMIFGAFLRDKNISSTIKSLLLKLQIPVIKIAMMDAKFFYNNKHPARSVMDEIAHIGIGIDGPQDTVLKTIDLIINQLLNSFDKNIVSFHTSLKALHRLKKIEQGKLDENEKQTKKNILKEHARQSVLTAMQFHIGKAPLPKPIQPLILNQWSTLMYHRFIRFGIDSQEWNECIEILNNIVSCTRKAECHDDLNHLMDMQDELHYKVESFLHETKINKEIIHNSATTLKLTLNKNISLSEKHLETVGISDGKITRERAVDPVEEELKIAKAKISKLPESVKPGTWFEVFAGENQSVRRLKLSVIIMDTAKLIFIDRMGKKVIEKDAIEFAREIDSGRSQFIADHSIFNHALSNVILSLSAQN